MQSYFFHIVDEMRKHTCWLLKAPSPFPGADERQLLLVIWLRVRGRVPEGTEDFWRGRRKGKGKGGGVLKQYRVCSWHQQKFDCSWHTKPLTIGEPAYKFRMWRVAAPSPISEVLKFIYKPTALWIS